MQLNIYRERGKGEEKGLRYLTHNSAQKLRDSTEQSKDMARAAPPSRIRRHL